MRTWNKLCWATASPTEIVSARKGLDDNMRVYGITGTEHRIRDYRNLQELVEPFLPDIYVSCQSWRNMGFGNV
jgi:hypothetical protein